MSFAPGAPPTSCEFYGIVQALGLILLSSAHPRSVGRNRGNTVLVQSVIGFQLALHFSSNHFVQILYLFVHPLFPGIFGNLHTLVLVRRIEIILFCTNYWGERERAPH